MNNEYIEKLNSIKNQLNRINGKYLLLKLLSAAKIEYDKNNYDDCIEKCREALSVDPQNAVALRGLGCSMQAMGKYDEAIDYYKRALIFSDKKEIEYTLLGTIYYWEDNLEEAIKYYNLAIDLNDNYDEAYEGRNQAMLENHLKIVDLQDSLIKREMFK